jgi:homoserine O-acetyltransferase
MIKSSVGTVTTQYYTHQAPLVLESGVTLASLTIAYETCGTLNRDAGNAVLLCHALSGDAHVAGHHEGEKRTGWWDAVVGPGKAFDTDRYFVICSNIIGGARGRPALISVGNRKPYGAAFPVITIRDMVM